MTKNDHVIICGDFGGVWKDSPEERYWLDWLNDKPFTLLYVDGNHENFDRYYSGEFQEVEYCEGMAHRIRNSIYHLKRGEVFNIQGKKFFTFGGASSHDIKDGIVDPSEYTDKRLLKKEVLWRQMAGQLFRVKGVSWWPQELPTIDEMDHGINTLEANNYEVDYVITHCLPQEVASVFSMGLYEPDDLTMYFNKLLYNHLKFHRWYCGHYHIDRRIMGKFEILYENIVRIE